MNADAFPTRQQVEDAAAYVRARAPQQPTVGLILGSGLSPLAEQVQDRIAIPYAEIPHFPVSTVEGHSGQLISGLLAGLHVVVMQGRTHFYEGYSMRQVTFPVRVMCLLGIDALIVTNAAGGLAPHFTPGDLMLIQDHINLVGMAGHNPLIGPNEPSFGPRFPDMAYPYDPELRQIAIEVAAAAGIPLQRGVYLCLAGPSFETPHEVHFLRMIGADAVGMSTVHEVIVARHMGVRVLGVSGITNVHSTDPSMPRETTHAEVLETGAIIVPHMIALLRGVLERL
ncbi:MAG: purine-nucleoside phosphorylase [Anaerolineae bacterium]|nr:purine-nucleoside phosphorylase [Anaerolineae bacterium]